MESTLFADLVDDELYDLDGGNITWRDVVALYRLSVFIVDSAVDIGKGFVDGWNKY